MIRGLDMSIVVLACLRCCVFVFAFCTRILRFTCCWQCCLPMAAHDMVRQPLVSCVFVPEGILRYPNNIAINHFPLTCAQIICSPSLQGSHTAMKTGMLAGQAAAEDRAIRFFVCFGG